MLHAALYVLSQSLAHSGTVFHTQTHFPPHGCKAATSSPTHLSVWLLLCVAAQLLSDTTHHRTSHIQRRLNATIVPS
jgi:hypothetical protein